MQNSVCLSVMEYQQVNFCLILMKFQIGIPSLNNLLMQAAISMVLCKSSNFSLAEFYLNLGRKLLQPTGSTSQLMSVQLKGSEEPQCLSFWWISSFLSSASKNRHVGYWYGSQLAPYCQPNADKICWNKTKRPCCTQSPFQRFCHSRSKSG
jgi:hypothetical protein